MEGRKSKLGGVYPKLQICTCKGCCLTSLLFSPFISKFPGMIKRCPWHERQIKQTDQSNHIFIYIWDLNIYINLKGKLRSPSLLKCWAKAWVNSHFIRFTLWEGTVHSEQATEPWITDLWTGFISGAWSLSTLDCGWRLRVPSIRSDKPECLSQLRSEHGTLQCHTKQW